MQSVVNSLQEHTMDKIGMSVSTICAIHCLLTPVLLPLLTLSGLTFVSDPQFELGLVALAVVLASYSILTSYFKQHKKLLPFYFFLLGITFVIIAKSLVSEQLERFVLPIGALLFTLAHGVNWRLCRNCPECKQNLVENESVRKVK